MGHFFDLIPVHLLLFTFQKPQGVAFYTWFRVSTVSVGELGWSGITQPWLALEVSDFFFSN